MHPIKEIVQILHALRHKLTLGHGMTFFKAVHQITLRQIPLDKQIIRTCLHEEDWFGLLVWCGKQDLNLLTHALNPLSYKGLQKCVS